MRYLVTGGAGFIGSHVVDLLAKEENEDNILIVDDLSTGRSENINIHWSRVSRTDILSMAMDGEIGDFQPDVIIHLAAQAAITTAVDDPQLDLSVNALGTLNVLKLAEKYNVKRFIYASTSAIYGSQPLFLMRESTPAAPDTYYGISKYAGELYTKIADLEAIILRFGNVYGPRQVPIGENQVIARMMRHMLYGDEFYIFGDGNQTRDFVYVEDVARAVVAATKVEIDSSPRIYHIAGGISYSVNEIAALVAENVGYPNLIWKYDHEREDARRQIVMGIDAAWNRLHWKPEMPIREGLQRTADWWKNDQSPHLP